MRYRLRALERYIRGWIGYFALSEYYRPLPEIDRWLRRRVRMCYSMAVGPTAQADQHAATSRSEPARGDHDRPQQSRPTRDGTDAGDATGEASNQWLKEQGLVSVRDLWVALNYP